MPKEYEAIRDSLLKRGVKPEEAKRIAAATYNKRHKHNPLHRESRIKPRRG